MRVAGYVRQATGLPDPDTAFAQSERVRRWARDSRNELIAVCQDHHASSAPTDRPGFKALVDIVRSGAAEAVVVGNLEALSPDKVMQEIMIADIRAAGATMIATEADDLEVLRDGAQDHTRIVVRDIVSRVGDYIEAFGMSGDGKPTVSPAIVNSEFFDESESSDTHDVVVELIAPTG
jgi:DNA invertase Pin-like site-specific DNA recombinase